MGVLETYTGTTGGIPATIPAIGIGASTPVIPKLYWDAYDDEQRIKKLWECFAQFAELYNAMVPQVNTNTNDNEDLKTLLTEIAQGKYADFYIDQLAGYIDNTLQQFIARLAYYMFPGFYWDGKTYRYAITVPSNWNFLKFSWQWVEADLSYHIVLSFGDSTV